MVQAIASELGAMLIDFSPDKLEGKFTKKQEVTKLVHMIFTVAKDPLFGPVIIYVDNCDQIFQRLKKKKGITGKNLTRFQMNFLIYKNTLTRTDNVIIIGCTKDPEIADIKVLKWKGSYGKPEKQGFFERFLYFPNPSYIDRLLLWQRFVEEIFSEHKYIHIYHELDYSKLSQFSPGYSTAMIHKCASSVLSHHRIQTINIKPLIEEEFLMYLHQFKKEDNDMLNKKYKDFTRKICDYDSKRKIALSNTTAKNKMSQKIY